MKPGLPLVILAALAICAPCSARAAGAEVPTPTLANVGGTTVVQQSDSAASLAGIALVVRAGLDRETMKQNGVAALVAQTILLTPVGSPAMSLQDAIAARGGSVRFTIDPSDVRFYIEALAGDAPAVLDLFRTALAAPDFSPATIRAARAALVRQIAQSQQQALQVGLDMLNAAASSQANAGLPELGTPASLAQIFSNDARAFYHAYYRRGGSLISAAGRLDGLAADTLSSLAAALPEGTTAPVAVHTTFAERRNARDRRAPRYLVAVADRPISGSKSRQRRFRSDARACGLRSPHAFGYRASSRRRYPDLCVPLGRRSLRLRPRAAESRALRQWWIDRQSQPRLCYRPLGRERPCRDSAARIDRRVQSRSGGRLRQRRDDARNAHVASGRLLTRKRLAGFHQPGARSDLHDDPRRRAARARVISRQSNDCPRPAPRNQPQD